MSGGRERNVRLAHDDIPVLRRLVDISVRGLSRGFYTAEQVDAALQHVFGVDTQLIADGTYYVVDDGRDIAAAGGWSRRRTLFGGDQMKAVEDPMLDPASEPARIRAFYVLPRTPDMVWGGCSSARAPRRRARPGFTT